MSATATSGRWKAVTSIQMPLAPYSGGAAVVSGRSEKGCANIRPGSVLNVQVSEETPVAVENNPGEDVVCSFPRRDLQSLVSVGSVVFVGPR